MAWNEDLQEIKYTSPGGTEFIFYYENLSIESEKKTIEFIFPEKDGAYIQDLGRAGRRFPFTCFFSGEKYNKDADEFLAALEEKGIGELVHPLYGTRKVIPTGSITRRDDLITESNQAAFSVTFSETIDIDFPETKESTEDEVNNSLDESSATVSEEFSENISIEEAGDDISLIDQMSQQFDVINDSLKSITSISNEINAKYQEYKAAYESNIENIVDSANELASQVINIIRLPAKIAKDAKSKIQVFSDLTTNLISNFQKAIVNIPNAFRECNKNIMACIIASNESVLYHTFATRNEAIETNEMLLTQFDKLKEFQDQYIVDLGIVDTGDGFDSLSKVIAKTSKYLISNSFSLPSEKKIILGNNRDIFSLVNEVYGNLDLLDDFISQNELTADEIENLPAKKEVVYYE